MAKKNSIRYIALYKPYGYTSHFSGRDKHQTLSEFNLPEDVYAAGRLDKDSEGLLVLTNDGDLIHRLQSPEVAHEKTYWAQVERIPDEQALRFLRNGVVLKGRKTKPCKARILDPQPKVDERNPPIRYRENVPETWLEIKLTEGKNRQVRRITAKVGRPTLRLIRVSVGKLNLWDLNLKPGEWKEVKKSDIV